LLPQWDEVEERAMILTPYRAQKNRLLMMFKLGDELFAQYEVQISEIRASMKAK
jgi:hypothetical protein